MNQEVECRTPEEAHAAIKSGDVPVLVANMRLEVAVNCKIVCKIGVAWIFVLGSSTANVESRETSTANVESWGTSTANVKSWETSTANVESRGTSTANVDGVGYSRLLIRGKITATAGSRVTVLLWGTDPQVNGGAFSQRIEIKNGRDWCDFYGVPVREDGTAVLFKATGPDFKTHDWHFAYTPGTTPVAPDWDGGKLECGGGLHWSPTVRHTLQFVSRPTHFVACVVKVDDLAVHPDGHYPDKCKGPGAVEPCWEVDINGNRIGPGPEGKPEPKKRARRGKKAA